MPDDGPAGGGSGPSAVGRARLRAAGLGKVFGAGERAVQALEGLDLEVADGEFVSVIGPSGCGKSTLFNILAGLEEPSAGALELDGARSGASGLLGRVGYMPQRDLLMPWRTILDNTILGLEVAGVGRAEARRRALELFPAFGLAGFERRRPGELSGGMRQRAALLRTFLAGREVILLDEPFGALDSLTRAGMQQWLVEVWEQHRKTIVLITHDVDEALFLSDRVYVLSPRPGRVVLSLEVDLPRPRAYELITSEPFVERKQLLLERLGMTLGEAS
ncbi:MAG TPA: ABC transporter ATP-binding protein [Actinomycetota bacterium]|nr:ABC transporter ATP-binding protein [Actinomycetota bacterium]